MALVTCSECENRISDEAKSCPQCGAPQTTRTRKGATQTAKRTFLAVMLFAASAIVVDGFVSGGTPSSLLVLSNYLASFTVKKSMRTELKDPDSATYRNIRRSSTDRGVICGEVNANNSFGAKVGYKRFVVLYGGAIIDSSGTDYFQRTLWEKHCTTGD